LAARTALVRLEASRPGNTEAIAKIKEKAAPLAIDLQGIIRHQAVGHYKRPRHHG
jgi:hypothetical protein